MKNKLVKKMVGTAILSAFSCVLYIFAKLSLPIFPSFLELQFSEIPCLIAGYAYGPLWGIFSLFIRALVKLPFSRTSFVGELGDLIIGIALVLPASLIYQKNRNKKGAHISFIIGALISIIIAMIINAFILVPFYVKFFFNGSMQPLLEMCKMIEGITLDNFMKYYLLFAVLPFNILRYIIVDMLTFILYKRVKFLLDKI